MGKLVINSYDEFAAHLGEELGASDWLQVDQIASISLLMPHSTTSGYMWM